MSALTIVKATVADVVWNLGGADYRTSSALVQAALVALTEPEVTVHGAIALLSEDELRRLTAAMQTAYDVWLETMLDRTADFESNWS